MNKLIIKYTIWDSLSRAIIIIFLFVMTVFISLSPNVVVGESGQYMLSSLALESRLSMRITQEDIDRSQYEFPTHYWHLKNLRNFIVSIDGKGYELRRSDNLITESNVYPWYFGTYSFLCIPMMKLMRFLSINRAYAFPLTNVLFYVIALTFVFFKLRTGRKIVFLCIVFLAVSPAVAYIYWPSAEVLIFTFVVISLVNLLNGSHKWAALFISLAGTLNPTVMMVGFAIILDYFWRIIEKLENRNIKNMIKTLLTKYKEILKLALCFVPFMYTLYFNYVKFNTMFPQTILGLNRSEMWGGRFLAYLFDLNFGFLPYFQINFILFFALIIYGIIKKKREAFVFALAFFGTVFAFAYTWHINCGMTGISRYNAWSSPILVIFICTHISYFYTKYILLNKILVSSLLISVFGTFIMSAYFTIKRPHYVEFTPIAKFILDKAPVLYKPYPYTFISRTYKVDGGYWDPFLIQTPVAYINDNGFIRKVLIPKGTSHILTNRLIGKSEYINIVEEKIENLNQKKLFSYVNINQRYDLKFILNWEIEFNPTLDKNLANINQGIYVNEGGHHWITQNATITLKEGTKKTSGIKIIYMTPVELKSPNGNEPNIQLFINNVFMGNLPYILEWEWKEYVFEDKNIPDSIDGFYTFKFITNGVYNPKKMGHSDDDRDLSFLLKYIGQL